LALKELKAANGLYAAGIVELKSIRDYEE